MDQKLSQTVPLSNDVLDLISRVGIEDRIEALLEMTQAVFPGPVTVELEVDPEWPSDESLVFCVEAAGDFQEILQRELQWHRNVRDLVPERLGIASLCIVPR